MQTVIIHLVKNCPTTCNVIQPVWHSIQTRKHNVVHYLGSVGLQDQRPSTTSA